MSDLPTPTQITDLANLLAPGLVIASIRTRAITGSIPDLKDRVIAYGVISVGYFAAVTPIFHVAGGTEVSAWLWNLLQYFLVPVVVGVLLAYAYQHRISYRLAGLIRLHLAHHLPSSWDFAFQALPECIFVLVTLTDGTQIAGRWMEGSFASSSREERDVLLSELWRVPEDGSEWQQVQPARSVLICGKDVRVIEFFGAHR